MENDPDLHAKLDEMLNLLHVINSKLDIKVVRQPTGPRIGNEQYESMAMDFFRHTKRVSVSALQRHFGIGYVKASSIMDRLEKRGLVSAPIADGLHTRELIDNTDLT